MLTTLTLTFRLTLVADIIDVLDYKEGGICSYIELPRSKLHTRRAIFRLVIDTLIDNILVII